MCHKKMIEVNEEGGGVPRNTPQVTTEDGEVRWSRGERGYGEERGWYRSYPRDGGST